MPLAEKYPRNSLDCIDHHDTVEVCPICLSSPSDALPFCSATCCHRFCVPDAERILMSCQRNINEIVYNQIDAAPHQFLPTLGTCPVCRQSFSLFELLTDDGKEFLHPKHSKIEEWPIVDKMFSELNESHSFSFDRNEGPKYHAYLGTEARVFPFQLGSHFHAPSRTFHGEVLIQQHDNVGGEEFYGLVILQFSVDFRSITLGAIMSDGVIKECFGVGGRMLHSYWSPSGLPERPRYYGDKLWGNVFCPGFKVGLASFHFLSLEESYISYEDTTCRQFPPLDDGSPIPSRAFFHNISFNEEDRTFRGEICWDDDHGTTWQGFQKWIYEIKFNSDFTFITSGIVQSILCDSEEPREMTSFEQDLNYINAAVDERLKEIVDDDREEHGEGISERFKRISRNLRHSWANENASIQTTTMLQHTLTRISVGEDSPIDYTNS